MGEYASLMRTCTCIYISPIYFQVRSYYDIRETKRLVDCNKYISLSNLLENPLLKTLIGSQFTDDDMVNIKFLSEACDNLLKRKVEHEKLGDFPPQKICLRRRFSKCLHVLLHLLD